MSWVRNAIKNREAEDYDRLHQTVVGGYGTKPNIFWAVDPKDMPVTLRENIEETVKDDTVGDQNCAIIRLETLPAYDNEDLQAIGHPVACFTVYIGTHGSNVTYCRQINIFGDNKPITCEAEKPKSQMWGEIEGNAMTRRLKRMSLTMGWSEPPPMIRRASSAIDGSQSPIRAPIAERHMSLAIPDQHCRAEAAGRSFNKRLSLRGQWMDSQIPPFNRQNTQEPSLAAALEALGGSSTTSTRTAKVSEISVSGTADLDQRKVKRLSMKTKRTSLYADIPETLDQLEFEDAQPFDHDDSHLEGSSLTQGHRQVGAQMRENEGRPAPVVVARLPQTTDVTHRKMKRVSAKRRSLFLERDIPEMVEMPMINFQNTPSQADPAALKDALAALEGAPTPREEPSPLGTTDVTPWKRNKVSTRRTSRFLENDILESGETPKVDFQKTPSQVDPMASDDVTVSLEGTQSHRQEIQASEIPDDTPQRVKRSPNTRVTLLLEHKIPEAGEPERFTSVYAPPIPPRSQHRKPPVECALMSLESTMHKQASTGKLRRPEQVIKSRKHGSIYTEAGSGFTNPRASQDLPEPCSVFETDTPEKKHEATTRKVKKWSWDVIGRALGQLRQTDQPSHISHIQVHPSASHSVVSTRQKPRRTSWLPTGRAIAEFRVGPSHNLAKSRAKFDVDPVPREAKSSSWYSRDPTVAEIRCGPRTEHGAPAPWLESVDQPAPPVKPGAGITRKSKRISWHPVARKVQLDLPSTSHEMLPATNGVPEPSAEDAQTRKKMNRISMAVFHKLRG